MKPTLLRGLLLAACLMIIPLAGWSRNIRIDAIEVTGNQITKDFIILRELPFSTGDTIPKKAWRNNQTCLGESQQPAVVQLWKYPGFSRLTTLH